MEYILQNYKINSYPEKIKIYHLCFSVNNYFIKLSVINEPNNFDYIFEFAKIPILEKTEPLFYLYEDFQKNIKENKIFTTTSLIEGIDLISCGNRFVFSLFTNFLDDKNFKSFLNQQVLSEIKEGKNKKSISI